MKLKQLLISLLYIQSILLTGCWNSRELNSLAISVCIGIDKTDNGYLLTQQIINPKAIASKNPSNEAPVIIYSETGKDIFETMRRLSNQCPRRIYSSHLRMVVFGEAFARDGIQDTLDFLLRDREFRTDFYFAIAKGTTANEVLSTLTPLESIPGISINNSLRNSEKSWGFTKTVRIIELVNSLLSEGKNPVLTGIEVTNSGTESDSTDVLRKTGNFRRLKLNSIGAFKKQKLIGWLDEDESRGFNYITGNVRSTVGYVLYKKDTKITTEIINTKSKLKTTFVKGKPVINVSIVLKAKIGAVDGSFDVSKEENKKLITQLIENKVNERCEKALKKVQGELKTDIFGFGEVIHRQYPKTWAKIKNNWDKEFTELPVYIASKVEIKELGEITKPLFSKEKE
jgi:spore germination protein KC